MNNRNSMAAVIYSTELYHHGVEGMSWGERNGPPYPLGGLDKKIARAEAKRKKARERALEKARKAAKKKRKAEARDQKIAAKQAKQQEKDQILKEKLLRKGDLKDIQRHRRLFTTQELNDAIIRSRVLEEIKNDTKRSKTPTKTQEPKKQIDIDAVLKKIASGANSIGTISVAALNAVKLAEGIKQATRATKLYELDVESKELDNLKKAFEASGKGDIADKYLRNAKKVGGGNEDKDKDSSKKERASDERAKPESTKKRGSIFDSIFGDDVSEPTSEKRSSKKEKKVKATTKVDDIPTVDAEVAFDPGSSDRVRRYWDTVMSMPTDDIPSWTESSRRASSMLRLTMRD